jgi:hypothetical protein
MKKNCLVLKMKNCLVLKMQKKRFEGKNVEEEEEEEEKH